MTETALSRRMKPEAEPETAPATGFYTGSPTEMKQKHEETTCPLWMMLENQLEMALP